MSYASGEAVAASAGPLAPGPTNIFLISEEDDEDMDDVVHHMMMIVAFQSPQ